MCVYLLVGYLAFLTAMLWLLFLKKKKKNSPVSITVQSTSHEVCNFVQTAGNFVLAKIYYKDSKSWW